MQNTNLNVNPYFDDYQREKEFYKVLFKPGYPVQSRELTTLQSILQNQIERFGQHIFTDGSMIIPGRVTFDLNYQAVTIQPFVNGINVENYRKTLIGKKLIGSVSGVTALVLNSLSELESHKGIITLYVKYINGGKINSNGTQYTVFEDNENLIDITTSSVVATTSLTNSINYTGCSASITSGVYFSRGYFIEVKSQTIILDQYNNKPSYKIGLKLEESIVSPSEDISIRDNSFGYPNFSAPGADRLKINAKLSKVNLDEEQDNNFIELIRLRNGILVNKIDRSNYAELGKNLAKRTYDESGNYYVNPFKITKKETLNNFLNDGAYELNSVSQYSGKIIKNGIPSNSTEINGNDYFTLQISPGKAYVKGYELETTTQTYIDLEKPRTSSLINNEGSLVSYGNYFELESSNLIGSLPSGSFTNLFFFDKPIGSSNANLVGRAKYYSLLYGSKIRLYILDFSTLTYITTSNNTNLNIQSGDFITGYLSGATGVVYTYNNSSSIILQQVSGNFIKGETITNSRNDNSITINSIVDYKTEIIKSVSSDSDLSSSTPDFRSNISLDIIPVSGKSFTVSTTNNITTLLGTDTNFLSELYLNTILQFGNTTTTVSSIESNSSSTLSSNISNQSYTSIFKLISTLKTSGNNHFSLIQNKNVNNVSDVSYSIVKNYNVNFTSGTASLPLLSNETASGDVVIQTSTNSMTGTISSSNTITINNNNNYSGAANVFVKVLISNPILRQKTLNSCVSLLVNKSKNSSNVAYGTRKEDKEISLAFPDVIRIHAIHQATSESYTNNNLFDSITVTNSTNFNVGDIVYSNQTNAKGKIISKSGNNLYLIYYTDSIFSNSNENNQIKNFTTDAETTVSTVTPGVYVDITNNYILDKNINNSIYDISKLIIKNNYANPQYNFIIIYDYYSHGSGDYFNVNSYQLNQVKYENIGNYDKNNLSDILDFRITANNISTTGNGSLLSPYILSNNSLSKLDRTLINKNLLYPGTTAIYDYSHYLGRIDTLVLNQNGIFEIFKGTPSLLQTKSEINNDNLKVASIIISPYVKNINDVVIQEYEYKRYTMSDINDLDKRLTNIEYYTSLNLLEIDTHNLSLIDENGFSRFKNGFAVDSFQDFTISDIDNVDYSVSLDFIKNEARPSHYTNNVDLEFNSQISTNYRKTGNIITLNYTDEIFVNQSFASRSENVNPFNVFAWIGNIELNPSSDNWITTIRMSDNIINVEGNFERTVREHGGIDTIQWGNWFGIGGNTFQRDGLRRIIRENINNTSLGDRILSSTSILYLRERSIGIKLSRMKPNYRLYLFINNINMTNYVIPSLIEINKGNIDEYTNATAFIIGEKLSFRPALPPGLLEPAVMPTPEFDVTVIKPSESGFSNNPYNSDDLPDNYTGTYSYLALTFNPVVNTPITISSLLEGGRIIGMTSGARATIKSKRIICDKSGQWNGHVFIPNPNETTNPKFINGQTTFRITPSSINSKIPGTIDTEAETEFSSSGTTNVVQQNIMSVRNARIENAVVREFFTVTWSDPLAQSFLVDREGGIFLTKIDLYFQSKDTTIPVNIDIRTMENGSPTQKIIPLSNVSLLPSNVNISENASIPTTFTFPSPVYLNQNAEYAFIVWANSDNYKVWIAKLGEEDVFTKIKITKNPYAGVLFKSQNSSTWTSDQYEDIKFVMYSAKFDNSASSELYFYNKPIPNSLLRKNPITMYKENNIISISHSNHCMHTTNNKVIIKDVKSEVLDTKLVTPLNNIQNTTDFNITLSDASKFHTLIGNVSISNTNPGYMKIGNEIILYSSISGNTVTIPVNGRGINNTNIISHIANEIVECYNLNGIPLIEINKTHNSIIPISLDTYNLTLNKNANINMTSGGNKVFASNNIQFEHITSNIGYLAVSGTTISSKINTITGTSISSYSNSQPSYQSIQNEEISIEEINNFVKPRLIASPINENNYYNDNKSLKLNLQLSSSVSNLSPVIDLERCSLITTSNRINKLSNNDSSLNSSNTKNESNYITKIFNLVNSSTSIKVLFDGVRFNSNSIRVYVKIGRDDTLSFNDSNYIQLKSISYPSSNDINDYKEFEYEIKNLPQFKSYSVKIELDSDNQALIPTIKKFRVIALAI